MYELPQRSCRSTSPRHKSRTCPQGSRGWWKWKVKVKSESEKWKVPALRVLVDGESETEPSWELIQHVHQEAFIISEKKQHRGQLLIDFSGHLSPLIRSGTCMMKGLLMTVVTWSSVPLRLVWPSVMGRSRRRRNIGSLSIAGDIFKKLSQICRSAELELELRGNGVYIHIHHIKGSIHICLVQPWLFCTCLQFSQTILGKTNYNIWVNTQTVSKKSHLLGNRYIGKQ